MTTDMKIAKIEEMLRKYEAVMVSLNAFVDLSGGGMDSPFADPICRLLDAHVDAVAELVGDEEEWISWYVAENDYGRKKPGVVLPDGRHITVDSVKRLVEVIEYENPLLKPEADGNCEDEMSHFEDLIGRYWDLAYAEGSGVPCDDDPNEVLHKLRSLIRGVGTPSSNPQSAIQNPQSHE